MLAIQLALPEMRRRGAGAIVNISSVAGIGWQPHSSPEYSAAKAGLARLTATLAPLAEQDRVRVNCIVPNCRNRQVPPRSKDDTRGAGRVPEVDDAAEIAEHVVELIEMRAWLGASSSGGPTKNRRPCRSTNYPGLESRRFLTYPG
jgi:NAD(P)-dependent dehydrogenase (short-subunit alcohol dehydrogenase family)